MRFNTIPISTFDELQVEAGIILKDFDPTTGAFDNEDILTATTGGITIDIKPQYSDFGEDVDNCPNNTKELKRIDEVDVSISTTALNISEDNILYMLGAADKDATTGKITLRKELANADFKDLWYVGDLSNGGFIAIKIINALSTDGFSLKTTKKAKGQFSVTLTGHYSINDVSKVPVELYLGGEAEDFISLSESELNLTVGDVVVLDVQYNPDSLRADATCPLNTSATPVSGEFTTDKKKLIVTANLVGTVTLPVISGGITGTCSCTVVAAQQEGEG